VTPENGLAKAQTSRPLCSTTAFSGSPNGFLFSERSTSPQTLCIGQLKTNSTQTFSIKQERPCQLLKKTTWMVVEVHE
jgi:hypothetical protein